MNAEHAGTSRPFPRRLRTRLGSLVAGAVVVSLLGTLALTDAVFGRLQRSQLEGLLARDLGRVQAVVRSGTPGQDFMTDGDGAGDVRLQFVSRADLVVLPSTFETPLAAFDEPTYVRSDGGRALVGSAAWVLPSGLEVGTIRIAMDLAEADAARATLRTSLLAAGALIAVAAGVAALWLLQRALRPLSELAAQAAAIDPAAPALARYDGPDDEVAELARALNAAVEGIRARQDAERHALAEVAHELAAPLTVVAGELRALADAHAGDPRLRAARDAADELLHTSQDLLTLARGELDRSPDLSVVDVAEVARSVVDAYPGVSLAIGTGDARVFAQADRLRQVVRNLVRNAVQAAGADGVRVSVGADGEDVRLVVEDDGPGIEPDVLARVFDRFVSGRPGGVGVGLTVAKRIVEAFEGHLEAWSPPGGPTRFEVSLPGLQGAFETV